MAMPDHPDFSANLRLLSDAAWAYAALATAMELGVLDELSQPATEADLPALCGIEPDLAADLVDALLGLGAIERDGSVLRPRPSFELLSSPSAARVMRGEIRSDHFQIRSLLSEAREGRALEGWRHEDPVILAAQGETGSLFGLLAEALVPGLDDLERRLRRPGFRLLDVGAGVGVISSELCLAWPNATAVGLEPHRTARELGRSRIAADRLSGRIELRDQRVEDLDEEDAYDLAFVPQPFLSRDALRSGLPNLLRALRPGGWLILLTHALDGEDRLAGAGRRFRARVWGGGALPAEELTGMLARAGFETSRVDHPVGTFRTVCAQRAQVPALAPDPLRAEPAPY
jgi:SAM-dependent methyltransferase